MATKEELDAASKQTLSQRIASCIKDIPPNASAKEVLRYLRGARINLRNLSNEVAKLEGELHKKRVDLMLLCPHNEKKDDPTPVCVFCDANVCGADGCTATLQYPTGLCLDHAGE